MAISKQKKSFTVTKSGTVSGTERQCSLNPKRLGIVPFYGYDSGVPIGMRILSGMPGLAFVTNCNAWLEALLGSYFFGR